MTLIKNNVKSLAKSAGVLLLIKKLSYMHITTRCLHVKGTEAPYTLWSGYPFGEGCLQ